MRKKSILILFSTFIFSLVFMGLIYKPAFADSCVWREVGESCPEGYEVVVGEEEKRCSGDEPEYSICCCPESLSSTDIPSPTTLENLGELITKVSGISTPLAVIGFIFSVIYAGFIRMTAAGNPEKEAKSMKIAIAAAVGFAIIALAPLAVRVLGSLLNVEQELIT